METSQIDSLDNRPHLEKKSFLVTILLWDSEKFNWPSPKEKIIVENIQSHSTLTEKENIFVFGYSTSMKHQT